MRNHGFATLTVVISQQRCIDNQNIHNKNKHMCLSCVRSTKLSGFLEFWGLNQLSDLFGDFSVTILLQPISVRHIGQTGFYFKLYRTANNFTLICIATLLVRQESCRTNNGPTQNKVECYLGSSNLC